MNTLNLNGEAVEYLIERSARRKKTIGVKVTADGHVIITAPQNCSEECIIDVMKRHSGWLLSKIKQRRQQTAPDQSPGDKPVSWYKDIADDLIRQRVNYYAPIIGVFPSLVKVKEQKKRWGSCSGGKRLYFNWRLAKAPPEIVDYVVVHELCHMREMNHSKRFWDCVASVMPDYAARRRWLKKFGSSLFHPHE